MGCWYAVCIFSQVDQQVYQQVYQQVDQQVDQQVRQQVDRQVLRQVDQQVYKQVDQQVLRQVDQQVRQQVVSFVWPYYDGHYLANYFAWVRAMEFIGVIGFPDSYGCLESCAELGLFYPLNNVLIIGSRPSVIHRNANGQLHMDQVPAIEYSDGWKLFFLNGIAMAPDQVLTPAERMSPESALKETNADRRRELIRKVGIERMLAKLPHKILHKRGDYQLLSVDMPEIATDVRYLKMLNPSAKCWHLEAINRSECDEKTVDAALKWRNSQRFVDAEILT